MMEPIGMPTGPIEISDPNSVPELFVNGPFNIMNMGAMVLLTFTIARPDIGQVLAGNNNPPFKGTIAARILMPTEMAHELMRVLEQNLATRGPAAGHG